MAEAYRDRAIGIVLTGANEDGAAGLAAIKRNGGVSIVQDPQTAERRTMPDAAIAAPRGRRPPARGDRALPLRAVPPVSDAIRPGLKLLLVDDRPENLLALEAILEPLDADLVRASSGEEALRRLLHEEFAAILLDVQMPGLDGFQTAELIKQRERTRTYRSSS